MWSQLMAIAARLRARGFPWLPPPEPEDPYAGVLEPRRRGPGGKHDAAAVAEPRELKLVRADSYAQRRGGSQADLER
jgi:hypothetical protein